MDSFSGRFSAAFECVLLPQLMRPSCSVPVLGFGFCAPPPLSFLGLVSQLSRTLGVYESGGSAPAGLRGQSAPPRPQFLVVPVRGAYVMFVVFSSFRCFVAGGSPGNKRRSAQDNL